MEKFEISEKDLIEIKEMNLRIEETIRKQKLRKVKALKFLKWIYK